METKMEAMKKAVARYEEMEKLQEKVRLRLEEITEIYGMRMGEVEKIHREMGRDRETKKKSHRKEGKALREEVRLCSLVGKPKAGRAPRGALREAIRKILGNGGQPIRAIDMVQKLKETGFKTASKPRVFYTSVYLALKNDKAIRKTAEGFRLTA